MRISLLRQREPFTEILEQTLARYFSSEYGGDFQVTWSNGVGKPQDGGESLVVNQFLNAIFHPSLAPAAFDPIRREYSRSTTAWKRPLQSVYVRCATNRPTARWLAHASLNIAPFNKALAKQLIIPGNQKIRILDHAKRTCTSVLKTGFRDDAMRAECKARQQAAELDINIPETLSVDIENGVLCESYVSATPLNRLANATQAQNALNSAVSDIQRLTESSRRKQSLSSYLTALVAEVIDRVSPYNKQNPQLVDCTVALVHFLQTQAAESATDDTISLSASHGDFQPANILLNDNGVWLIDWENSAERQSGYDWLVFHNETRSKPRIAERLVKLIDDENVVAPDWTELQLTTRRERIHHLAIFLLEELAAKANEISQPAIPAIATDFVSLVDQVTEWQTQTVN